MSLKTARCISSLLQRKEGGRKGWRERERETVYGAAFSPARSGEGELQGSTQRPTS